MPACRLRMTRNSQRCKAHGSPEAGSPRRAVSTGIAAAAAARLPGLARRCGAVAAAAAAPARLADDTSARDGRLARRSGRAAQGGAVRLPLPVPRGRREHGSGLGDLEPGRLVRHLLRPRVVGAGEIPVFSYYQLLQSKPDVSGGEAQADLAHLDDPSTMAAYWRDVRLFFQRAHGTKTVVLHVEPDLWGYIEQRASGDDAATVPAVVPDGCPRTPPGSPRSSSGSATSSPRTCSSPTT